MKLCAYIYIWAPGNHDGENANPSCPKFQKSLTFFSQISSLTPHLWRAPNNWISPSFISPCPSPDCRHILEKSIYNSCWTHITTNFGCSTLFRSTIMTYSGNLIRIKSNDSIQNSAQQYQKAKVVCVLSSLKQVLIQIFISTPSFLQYY